MKLMNQIKRYGKQAALGSTLMGLVVSAQAAVPAEVTTALTEAKTDSVQVAGIVLGILVALYAFVLMRKPMR